MNIGDKTIPLLALVVSISSAMFSFAQYRTSSAQFRLTEQQLRPHVSYVPTFFTRKSSLNIDMYLQNQSPLPANVLFTDIAAWIDDQPLAPNFHSMSPDILYQERGSLSSLPPIKDKRFGQVESGSVVFTLATCVIYGSTSKSDSRRWLVQALNEYIPGSSLPKRLFIQEDELSTPEKDCSAGQVRARASESMANPAVQGR